MAQTYSQGLTGVRAGSRYNAPKVVQIGDTDISGNVVAADGGSFVGSQQGAMQRGSQILCKNPDGSQSYHVIDAERSIPGQLLIVRAV